MESGWAKIEIGGTITAKVWEKLKKAIYDDTGRADPSLPGSGTLTLEDEDIPYGIFDSVEILCNKEKIPFIRESAACGEANAEYVYHRPTSKSFRVTLASDMVTQLIPVNNFMELRIVLRNITLENAPQFINDKSKIHQEYARHLLSGKSLMTFLEKFLEDEVPPETEDLPAFKVKKGR